MRRRLIVFIAIIQSILFLAHWFLYTTWMHFWPVNAAAAQRAGIALALLSVSFVSASLLAFRFNNALVRVFYTLASVWMGLLNFLTWAACLCWLTLGVARVAGLHPPRALLLAVWWGAAVLATLYGLVNAARVRVRRITVALPGLPERWRGRQAALVTDTHLGHVRGVRFMQRIVRLLRGLRPDIVFISGDLFDGTPVDHHRMVEPWKSAGAPEGVYFVTGNHDEFSASPAYLEVLAASGIRVLNNEKVEVEGLQIVGVNDRDSGDPARLRSVLEQARLDRSRASILLCHVPHGLPIAEQQGISLQLSGHTHGGQFFPFTWFTGRIFRQYTYGLQRHGDLTVYTSSGAGTWGPPMRVGTGSEVVLIRLEQAAGSPRA